MNIPKIAYKDFLINQKQPDRKDKDYIDFWLKHIDYCKSGVIVGGVYISGWLYWHLNFFKAPIDGKDQWGNKTRLITNLPLRDNEYFIDWGKQQSQKQQKPLLIFGSRRIAKSVTITSEVAYTAYLFINTLSLVACGSAKDLNNITSYFNNFYENRPDCFSDLMKFGDFGKEGGAVEIAFNKAEVTKKDRATGRPRAVNPITSHLMDIGDDKKYIFSQITVANLEGGIKSTKTELLAGITPSKVIFDEYGKGNYGEQYAALRPALMDSNGEMRTLPLISGTGGDVNLSKSAEDMFLNADEKGITVIDAEEYKKIVKPKYFQYKQESDVRVSLFPCAQMSFDGGKKIEIPLSEYLNREFTEEELKDLDGFNILVTDWENATKKILELHKTEAAKGDLEGKKAIMYAPLQPEDCFLYSGNNPFPTEEARKTQLLIKDKGMTGEYVELEEDEYGFVKIKPSTKVPVSAYPFEGGTYDAPVVILERPISDTPQNIKHGSYVAGFDGYKIGTSETSDSLGALYIFKRNVSLGGFKRQIVAHISTRPQQDVKFYRQVYLLLKMYNAELLPERDVNLYNYFKQIGQLKYWANCKNLVEGITPNSRADSTYGLPATHQNKEYYLKLIQNYCHEEILQGYDAEDNPIYVKGVERIHDPMLLEELIKFGKYKNYDRIIAFGHALAWDAELGRIGRDGGLEDGKGRITADSLINRVRKNNSMQWF